MTFRWWRGWANPPLVVQILALLVGAMLLAQLVTLLLTLVLPPEPPQHYEMSDIAAALNGETTARPFERRLQAGPPDLAERGWLVSPATTARLARSVGVPADRVVLGFYTELPIGAPVGAPPLPRLPLDARPTVGYLPGAAGRPGEALAALARLPMLALGAAIPAASAQQGPPGGRPASNGAPGPNTVGGYPSRGEPRSAGAAPGGPRGGGNDGGVGRPSAVTPPLSVQAARLRTQLDRVQPPTSDRQGSTAGARDRGADGSSTPGAYRPPMSGPPAAPHAETGSIPGRLPGDAWPAMRLPLEPVAEPPRPRQSVAPDRDDEPAVTAKRASPPRAALPISPEAVLPVRRAPAAAIATATRSSAVAPAILAAASRPLPIARPVSGLFGLASAPFVEGDFIAAVKTADGRWAVVSPAEEGFPNAWQRRVLLWFGLSLLVVAPLAWAFARRIVGPLQGFARAAEMLGRDPSAAVLPLDGPAEVGRAAHAFNQMQSRLHSFVDDRTAMIGAISHDLRTPLTRLRFRIEDVPEEQHGGLLGEIEAMEAMISSVITYMHDAATPGVRERRDFAKLVGDVVEDAALIGGDVTTVTAEPAPVDIDALGMRRVLDNLLTNAMKYGGGTARVALRVEDACAVADIVDNGPGIPEAEIERVFEPFYRSEAARASQREGSGLGLAVCRSIARAHGGDVRLFRSPAGFTARVTLPLAYDGERQLAA